jgi:hypothetical protein
MNNGQYRKSSFLNPYMRVGGCGVCLLLGFRPPKLINTTLKYTYNHYISFYSEDPQPPTRSHE